MLSATPALAPFRLVGSSTSPWPGARRVVSAAAERLLALPQLNDVYADAARRSDPVHFCERALAALDVTLDIADGDLARVPRTGPLVVVANHPFGGVDGLALAALLARVRPDVKLFGNHLLGAIPDLQETLLLVDPFGGPTAARRNTASLRAAIRWVRNGGALAVFPAGEVSRLDVRARGVVDAPWAPTAAWIARRTGAAVVPCHFAGRNSAAFQVMGIVHPRLRTAMLPREFLKRRGSRVTIRVGTPILPDRLARFGDAGDATAYLRVRTHLLASRDAHPAKHRVAPPSSARPLQSLAPPEDPAILFEEISALPEDRLLATSGALGVYYGTADELPATLREIGRLREATFRLVGEGTGRASDLDVFDRHYLHLFVWHAQAREVVGAYRLGLTDAILPTHGAAGLYTNTLFRYRGRLLRQLTPAIELGRSFVRPEYQKEYAPLMLLWKGIGRFVARHPRYRLLFGPVSISNEYRSLSKQILMSFLQANRALPGLGRLLVPRNPPRIDPPRHVEAALAGTVVSSIEEVDDLLAEIESDGRRAPVLLRQYLKLGARLLGFNVDPSFSDVLDGLMLVDLMKVAPVLLGRYLGRENLQSFYAYHAA